MKHRPLVELRQDAKVTTDVAALRQNARELRRSRLQRLAALLECYSGPLTLIHRIEYVGDAERRTLRSDNSPLTVAYNDPVFRQDGLASDRLGDAMDFFQLTRREAHFLLCECHFVGVAVTPQLIAKRVRSIINRMTIGDYWTKIRSAFAR